MFLLFIERALVSLKPLNQQLLKAEIITIGDEILIGQIVDTNSQWMAKALNRIGISVYQVTSIQDDEVHILKALKDAENNADIVLITGGLGPTKDDITKHTLATYFNDALVLDTNVVAHVKALFEKRDIPFSELNRLQGMVPSRCKVLENNFGTAPGMLFEERNTVFISMPGVPFEMEGLMNEKVLPYLQEKFTLPHILHKTIITYGMGESSVAELLESWELQLPKAIKLAYLPAPGKLRLRMTAKGDDLPILKTKISLELESLHKILGDIIVGYEEDETIEKVIGTLLTEQSKSLSIAESCTGGAISNLFVQNSGASNYFKGGLVAYSAEIKKQELAVAASLIEKYSVVSTQVAEAMAIGVQKKMKTDFSIATTGNAGPAKDKTDKSVGCVCIAIATPTAVYSEEFNFGAPRDKVIQRSTHKALELLRKEILKNYKK